MFALSVLLFPFCFLFVLILQSVSCSEKSFHIFGNQFSSKIIPLLDECQKSLKIMVFEWRFYKEDPSCCVQLFNQAIIRCHNRGVKVEVITNTEKTVKILKTIGIKAKKASRKKLLHAKIIIIDEKSLVIGSHNYTKNAFCSNIEVSTFISNCKNIKSIINLFNNIFKNYV